MSNVSFVHTASPADSHSTLANMPHFLSLYFRFTLRSALSLVISKFVESSLSRDPLTCTHHNECTLFSAVTLGPEATRACSKTSRTNNGTLTISTPLWVTQMSGLRNLYLSIPPISMGDACLFPPSLGDDGLFEPQCGDARLFPPSLPG